MSTPAPPPSDWRHRLPPSSKTPPAPPPTDFRRQFKSRADLLDAGYLPLSAMAQRQNISPRTLLDRALKRKIPETPDGRAGHLRFRNRHYFHPDAFRPTVGSRQLLP